MMNVCFGNKKIIEARRKDLISVIIWMMALIFITNLAEEIEKITGLRQAYISVGSKTVLFLVLLFSVRQILQRWNKVTTGYVVGIVSLLVVNTILGTRDEKYIGTVRDHILLVFPMVIVITEITDYDLLIEKMIWLAKRITAISFILLFFRNSAASDYSMGLANSITLPVIALVYDFYINRKKTSLIFIVLGSFAMLVSGSRGSLLGIVIFTVLLLARGLKSRDKRFKSFICISIILLAFIFMNPILSFLAGILGNRGWDSRTLILMMNDIGHDSGRGALYAKMIEAVRRNPLAMHGIAGEYQFIGTYAHDWALELLIDFGAGLGGLMVVYIAWLAIKTMANGIMEETPYNMLRLMLFSVGLPVAFVSGTVWKEPYLWMWIFFRPKVMDPVTVLLNMLTEQRSIKS